MGLYACDNGSKNNKTIVNKIYITEYLTIIFCIIVIAIICYLFYKQSIINNKIIIMQHNLNTYIDTLKSENIDIQDNIFSLFNNEKELKTIKKQFTDLDIDILKSEIIDIRDNVDALFKNDDINTKMDKKNENGLNTLKTQFTDLNCKINSTIERENEYIKCLKSSLKFFDIIDRIDLKNEKIENELCQIKKKIKENEIKITMKKYSNSTNIELSDEDDL
jgi:hypothetical protein